MQVQKPQNLQRRNWPDKGYVLASENENRSGHTLRIRLSEMGIRRYLLSRLGRVVMSNESWKNERIAASPLPGFPDDLPQQRISEVVTLPDQPEGLEVRVELLESYPHYPVRTPRKVLFLGGVEWARSPANSRRDSYYLYSKPEHWMLWDHLLDD